MGQAIAGCTGMELCSSAEGDSSQYGLAPVEFDDFVRTPAKEAANDDEEELGEEEYEDEEEEIEEAGPYIDDEVSSSSNTIVATAVTTAADDDAADVVASSEVAGALDELLIAIDAASVTSELTPDMDAESVASSSSESYHRGGVTEISKARSARRAKQRTYLPVARKKQDDDDSASSSQQELEHPEQPALKKRTLTDVVCERLRKVLDGLCDVSVEARRCSKRGNGESGRLRVVAAAAMQARIEVRASLETALLGDPGAARKASRHHKKTLLTFQSRVAELREPGDSTKPFSVVAARRDAVQRDARCLAYLTTHAKDAGDEESLRRFEALKRYVETHGPLQKGWIFQKALLLDQLRFSSPTHIDEEAVAAHVVHDREALSFGSTPFASLCKVMASEACRQAKERCELSRGDPRFCLVLGASSGSLCAYCASLGLRTAGVELLPTLHVVSRGLARRFHPSIPLEQDNLHCADLRDEAVVAPLLRAASIVVLTSTCWDAPLLKAARAIVAKHLPADSIVIDYSPTFDKEAGFQKVAVVDVPVSWCLDATLPIHIYEKKTAPLQAA